jgi:hypothetical protein
MIITEGSEISKKVDIVSQMGKKVNHVKWFNTKTKDAEIYVILSNGEPAKYFNKGKYEAVTAKVTLYGYKVVNRKTKNEVIV